MKRRYPGRPVAAVGGVVLHRGKVVLVKRGVEPYAGRWSIPGGAIELGETAEMALKREVLEETGLKVEPLQVVDIYDNILEAEGTVQYHYVIIDYLCRYISGALRPGSDVEDAHWVSPDELGQYETTPLAPTAIAKAAGIGMEHED